jgi:hypothetical protein
MKMARHTPEAEKPASLPVTKLEPTEAEQAEILVLAKRKKARRQAPRFAVHRQEGSQVFQVMPTDVHADAAGARVMNAFGTTSTELAERLVSQIMNTTHLQPSNEPVNANTLNAALAAVTGIAPRDEAEAMLATQMVAVHWVAMDLLRKANDHALLHDAGNLAVKLRRVGPVRRRTMGGGPAPACQRYRRAGRRPGQRRRGPRPRGEGGSIEIGGTTPWTATWPCIGAHDAAPGTGAGCRASHRL